MGSPTPAGKDVRVGCIVRQDAGRANVQMHHISYLFLLHIRFLNTAVHPSSITLSPAHSSQTSSQFIAMHCKLHKMFYILERKAVIL